MVINTFVELEEFAKELVLYAITNIDSEDCFFERQTRDSIFYKAYDDISNSNMVLGSSFAILLKDRYEIEIPVG